VDSYKKYRPTYPAGIIDVLIQKIGLDPDDVVADIGAGTGISSELFLRNGNVVYSVEPNDAMRRSGEELRVRFPQFESIKGAAEETTLPGSCIDLIVAGQAFHWFDRPKARIEFGRIAKPKAHIVLMWNDRNATSAFMEAYEGFVREYSIDYNSVSHQNISDELIVEFFHPHRVQKILLPNTQVFGFEGLKGRNLSASYMPNENDARFAPAVDALRRIFDRHQKDGKVLFELETRVYWGKCGAE
jgi:ubiquinone/menaquinone biosynthesis C-methylase UbiE